MSSHKVELKLWKVAHEVSPCRRRQWRRSWRNRGWARLAAAPGWGRWSRCCCWWRTGCWEAGTEARTSGWRSRRTGGCLERSVKLGSRNLKGRQDVCPNDETSNSLLIPYYRPTQPNIPSPTKPHFTLWSQIPMPRIRTPEVRAKLAGPSYRH